MGTSLRILFLPNGLYRNANVEIVYQLAKVLHEQFQCDITLMGYTRGVEYESSSTQDGIKRIVIRSVSKLFRIWGTIPERRKRMLAVLVSPECYRYFIVNKFDAKHSFRKEYEHALRHLLKKQHFDCIIGVSIPTESLTSLLYIKTDIPFIAYKLDPWSTHFELVGIEEEKQNEQKVDAAASAIVVTDLIRKDYPADTSPAILEKLHVLNFPNIVPYQAFDKPVTFMGSEAIHCVFTGRLYSDIRNPKYTFELFKMLEQNNIILHIYGRQMGEQNCIPDVLPANIIFHGEVDSDTALNCMQSADILVNIGNTVLNMMPSKLLTYISTGKPILNIIKDPACPTVPYMEKYPLALNILETERPTEEDVSRARNFILHSKGKQIPFAEIEQRYYDCTPEYVGGKLYEIICGAIEKRKNEKAHDNI